MKTDGAPERARAAAVPLRISLIAEDVTVGLVMQLLGVAQAEAQEAIDAWVRGGLLSAPGPEGRARVLPSARDAAFANTTPRQRRQAYADIARTIDDPAADDAELLSIARYYRDGAHHRLAVARYLSVAEGHLDRGERAEAKAVLAEIAQTVRSPGPEMLAALDLQAQCAMNDGDLSLALAVLDRLRRLAAICGDRFAIVRALLRCAECNVLAQSWDAAIDAASRVVALCENAQQGDRDFATALLLAAEASCECGRALPAQRLLQQAQALGTERETSLRARFEYVRGKLLVHNDPLAALVAFSAAAQGADDQFDTRLALQVARANAAAHRQNADLFSAAAGLRTALHVARRANLPTLERQIALDLIDVRIEAGRLREALEAVTPELEAMPAPVLLRLAQHLKNPALIERWFVPDALDDALASRNPFAIATVVPCFAQMERRSGDTAAAEALYRRALDVLDEIPATTAFLCDAAEFCGRADLARVGAALERARVDATPFGLLLVELGSITLDGRCRSDPAALTARAERVTNALLAAGFKMWARRLRALTAPAARGRGQDVLSLIAAGYSNGEIADRLLVSKRTVEKTIGELLKSQSVRSRWQLVPPARS